jgi:hypothetical protein
LANISGNVVNYRSGFIFDNIVSSVILFRVHAMNRRSFFTTAVLPAVTTIPTFNTPMKRVYRRVNNDERWEEISWSEIVPGDVILCQDEEKDPITGKSFIRELQVWRVTKLLDLKDSNDIPGCQISEIFSVVGDPHLYAPIQSRLETVR